MCWDGGAPPHACVFPSHTATAADRGSEQGMLCAGGQDQAMGPGSGSPEMAARRNLAPRPPRPPLPQGSPALRAGPQRPPACSIQPTKQHQVPAPREVKHPLVWGWHSPARGWGWSPGMGGSSIPRVGRMQAAAVLLVERGVFVRVDMCVSAHLRCGSQAGECVTTIWGRPRGLARAEQASPG